MRLLRLRAAGVRAIGIRAVGIRAVGIRAVGILLGVLAALLLAAASASAHAYVISVDPANGSQVDAAPTSITVTFSEPVTLAAELVTTVLDSQGERVDSGHVELVDGRTKLIIGLREGLAKDRYIASWTVVSADTHPVGGSVQFGYGVPALPVSAPVIEPSVLPALAVALVKGVLYLALIVAVGMVPAAAVLGADGETHRRIRTAARWATGVAVLTSVVQVVVQYLWDASALPGGATVSGLVAFATTPFALAVYVRIGLLVSAAAVAPAGPTHRARMVTTILLGVAALIATVRNGHGGAGAWWQYLSTVLHVTAAVAWLGGLLVLTAFILRSTMFRHIDLPRWSIYAAAAVGVIAVTGLVQSLVQVRYPGALVTTTYGVVLIAKVALVVAAVALGWWGNRWVRTHCRGRPANPAAEPPPPRTASPRTASPESVSLGTVSLGTQAPQAPPPARLRQRVRIEAALGALIVVISGLLSTVAPGTDVYAPTRVLGEDIGPYSVRIEVGPARRGPQTFRITVIGESSETPTAHSLELDLGLAEGGVSGLSVDFPYRLPGAIRTDAATPFTFVSSSVPIPDTGTWTGTLTVIADAKQQYTAQFTYRVV